MSRHRRELQQLTIDGQPEVVATVDLSPSWGGKRAGAGRKRTAEPSKVVAVRLPRSIYQILERAACKYGVSPAAYIRDLLEEDGGRAADRWLEDDLTALGSICRLDQLLD